MASSAISEDQRRCDGGPARIDAGTENAGGRVTRRVKAGNRAVIVIEHAPPRVGDWPTLRPDRTGLNRQRTERTLADRTQVRMPSARVAHVVLVSRRTSTEFVIDTIPHRLVEAIDSLHQ